MGMSTSVIGFRPPDEKWHKMKAVWDACHAAGTPVPKEVEAFFDAEEPDPNGVVVYLPAGVAREYRDGYREGIEVDITKLPKDVTVVRFYNSW